VGKQDKYYDKDGITVRNSIMADVDSLKNKIRQSDVDEIWASNNVDPEEALRRGIAESIYCCTICNGSPIGIFGIVPETILGNKAVIWMLSSEEIKKIKVKFLRTNREFIDNMLEFYPYLYNYVDARNEQSLKWLKHCGATIKDEAEPYGVEGKPFKYFHFNRKRR